MEKQIIGRGLLAGLVAGVLAFVWARIMIEPIVGRAIDIEGEVDAARQLLEHGHAHDAGGGHSHGEAGAELFGRSVQSGLGLGVAIIVFAVAMGALMAVVFCVLYGRTALSSRALAALISGGMLVSLWIVPALKYPPNPPAVGLEETIRERAFLYLLMVVISAVLLVGAIVTGHKAAERFGIWNGALIGALDYLVTVGLALWLMPTIAETPKAITDATGHLVFGGFPADDLYHFRLYSLGTQVIMWAVIAVVFGALVHRMLEGDKERESISA